MGQLPKETNYWEEAEEFFSKNKENITPGTTVIFKEKIIDVKSNFDDKAFIDLVMKVSPDGETFSLIPLLYNDQFEAKNPDIKPKAISMTEYFNDDMDRSFMAEIRLGDFTEDIIRLKEHYNIPLSKQEGDYLEEILGESLDEADITDIVPEEELVVAPDDISSIDTPTNVVDDGIELYHSISKGETVNKNFHAGTYNAALDRASQFYGGEQLYKIANDNLDFIQEQANDLVSELSEQVSFENVDDMFQITDDSVTREVSITLPTGNEARFNIVAETFDNTLTVKFQDVDGYDGGQIYSEELLDIDYEPDDLKTFVGDIDIVDDETVASNLLDEIGLKSQAGEFNYKDGYDLYKVNIKPGANVVNIPDTAIFIENGIEKEMSSDFIQGFIERPKEVNRFTDVTQIIIDNKTYDISDTFTSSQALQEHFKNADVLVYTNDIEDVGSKSYMFLNENSYVLEKIDNAQFNIDVANKYIKNNPYETISKLARREAFTEPERYQVLLNALLDETDTPTNVVDNLAKQVDVQDVRIYFNEAYNKFNEEYMPWNYFENFLINEKELSEDVAKGIIDDIKVGLTKPEFTNFPQSTFDPNLFPKAGTNFDSAVSRNMFNSSQVQRELSSKYILENVEDYFNLSNEQSTKLANTFYEGINPRTTGTIEFYVQQQSPNRILAGDIKSGLDMTHQIPGFYTEPIGNRSLSAIRGVGSNAPINNYYKVQVNTDNLLVDIAPARFAGTQGPLVSEGDNVLGRQINKINWDTFTKETGITYEMLGPRAKIIDGQKYYTGSVQDFSRSLNTFQPNRNITGTTSTLSKGNVWEALRKSGIEGFVSGPVNVQYEIVFLDPNDNLGIGKRMNIQDTTVQEFQSNKAAVSQLDELVIEQKPITNLNTYNQEDLNKLGGGNQLIDESKVTQLDETTNAFKTQSNDIVQKLPIEKEVKDKIAKNIARLKVRWGTWSGPLELLDIYETGVMLFYGVVAAAPELKSYANTLMKDMYNTMIEFSGMENYGLKKLSGSDYEPNWSYIGEQVDKAEKILPSEMFIEAIKEYGEPLKNISHRGFIPVIDTRKKLETTLTDPKTPEKEDTGPSTYDKIKDTIGEWWKKPIVVYDR